MMAEMRIIPIYLRFGDNPDRLIGKIEAENADLRPVEIAEMLRFVADRVEARADGDIEEEET